MRSGIASHTLSHGVCATGILLAAAGRAEPGALPVPPRGFVSSQPARIWEEGLLSGNGTIGINVLGRPLDERIIFTHERLFMPMGPPVMPADQSARLFEVRSLIDRGLYRQATELQFNLSGQKGFLYPDNFVPAFDLTITSTARGAVRDYSRSVDFQTAETAVRWSDDRGTFERRMFASRSDRVAVLSIAGSAPGLLDCRLALEPREPSDEFNSDSDVSKRSDQAFKEFVSDIATSATDRSLTYRNRYPKAYPGSIHTIEGHARAIVTGGATEAQANGTLVVKGADRILVLVDLRPVYDPDAPAAEAMEKALAALPDDYALLLRRHAELHGALFTRARLDLGGGADHRRTTEELIAESTCENPNRALIEKEFDAGRYNIICSTGELPPNLQGVWGGTYVPGWASDYTHNGNVPSAIAANLMGNLPELMRAYTSYIESLVPWLEVNAKHLFGARGIVLPSRSSTHGFNNALAPSFAGGFWVGGAGWAAHFFYDYYLYTGDRAFLADHALPFMEKAVLFFEDFLYEGPDGRWVFSPTQSPENTPGNTKSQGTFNATMDVAVAKELLQNTIDASRELGRNEDRIPRWQRMLAKMPDYQVDERGIIKEWITPKLENNDSHRHSSQLYPLYDGMPDEIARSPRLRAAFKKSIEFKLDHHWQNNQRGFMSFGLVQLGQAAASLGDGELAYRCLVQLANRFWLSNLASMHNHRSLFNMDISGGMPAVIIKMLVASEPGRLQLLPALPKAWPTGTIEGVLARGQIEVRRLHWTPGGVECTLRSGKAQTVVLDLPAAVDSVTVDGKPARAARGKTATSCTLKLPAAVDVSCRIAYGSEDKKGEGNQ
ncbi:MAG: alpha-L-fucosidase [Lentisphaerae bacterium]|nr:alpha-L-fucosidase [Lentisphaerota bacterium]